MANSIDWGKTYCKIYDNSGWGEDTDWSTFAVSDISAPLCWGVVPVTPFTADLISYFGGNITVDNATFKADKTQL